MNQPEPWDVVVVGAGAAGLFCAARAGQHGLRVLVLDHAKTLGEKIRISGGGRCNFTNLHCSPAHFLSKNPQFVSSALQKFKPSDFVALVKKHGIAFHEKHRGQLFCNDSSKAIVDMLMVECHQGRVTIRHPVDVQSVYAPQDTHHAHPNQEAAHFNNALPEVAAMSTRLWQLQTSDGPLEAYQLVVATGGLPVPAIGASAWGLDLARQLGLQVTPVRPGLVPLALDPTDQQGLEALAGLSLPVEIRAGQNSEESSEPGYGQAVFQEDLLLTHKGLSGPAVLQASSYWQPGEPICVNWLEANDISSVFDESRHGGKRVENLLAQVMPQRLAQAFASKLDVTERRWAELNKKDRDRVMNHLTNWQVKPTGSLGWKKAEVMLGGVDTHEINPQTMMSKRFEGLYFIGECLDVTGHLGGHNFQWAWASAFACASALSNVSSPHLNPS